MSPEPGFLEAWTFCKTWYWNKPISKTKQNTLLPLETLLEFTVDFGSIELFSFPESLPPGSIGEPVAKVGHFNQPALYVVPKMQISPAATS